MTPNMDTTSKTGNDLIIIGSGAAGLAASIYASRYKIDHLVFDPSPGGQINDASTIENYPGFESISGVELSQKFRRHAESYGVKILPENIVHLERAADGFAATTEAAKKYRARAIILAMGAKHRRLSVPGEEELIGRGVSYCATCDAPLFKGKTVAVVGGGDSAVSAAAHVSEFAEKVYLLAREQKLKAEPIWIEKLNAAPNVETIFETTVKEIKGEGRVKSIITAKQRRNNDIKSLALNEVAVDGVFIEIGLIPAIGLTKTIGVELDDKGYIKIGPRGNTNVPGVFAAGDLAASPGTMNFRQIITSAAEGAIAAAGVYNFLKEEAPKPDWG
jgi:thioredoxin reductase (NADPH)